MKALLVSRGIDFPKTHDLLEIAGFLPVGIRPGASTNELAVLTSYAVEPRYPTESGEVTKKETLQALCIAGGIRQTILRRQSRKNIKTRSG